MPGGRRLLSLGIVVALHIAVVAALLTLSRVQTVSPRPSGEREIIWLLTPKPPHKTGNTPRSDAGHPEPATTDRPDYRGITIPASPFAQAPSGLNGALFGCTNPGALSPEERARCGAALGVPQNTVDFRDGTGRARAAALWERGRQRKNAPLLLPCMNPQAVGDILGTALCLAKTAADGDYKVDEHPGYTDKPEIRHLPNGGDPPDHPGF